MDHDKLIDGLKNSKGPDNCHDCALGYWALMGATALSTLQAENEKLREELEQAHESLDFARTKDAEIVRLGAALARVTTELNDLRVQRDMYGGDVGITETYKELERVTAERDAAVEDISSVLANAEEIRRGYGVDNADADAAFADLCGNYCAKCGNNCYEEAEDYRCKNFKWRGI